MLLTTLPRLRCPAQSEGGALCLGTLSLSEIHEKKASDVLYGTLACANCQATYPILAGVAVLVNQVENYLAFHVKGISALVADERIPNAYVDSYLQAKSEIQSGLIEEDLESQRVNALYLMNHYLRVKKSPTHWWRPAKGFSPEIDRLVRKFWDHGPFAKIVAWAKPLKSKQVIELGCGVGGLARALGKTVDSYLGVDTAFASIALARHLNTGAPYSLPLRVPEDLLNGPLTAKLPPVKPIAKNADFVVGEIECLPVARGEFDLCAALNTIDMIEDPRQLPALQFELLKKDGVAIQSDPYIWHQVVAERLRKSLPKSIRTSSAAVEHLYQQAGFEIFKKIEHLPWLFLKHYRQIEVYSVHLFAARKAR